MDLATTLIAAVTLLVLAAFFGWRGARPADVSKGPRMIPWRPMMMACAVGLMLMIVHLVNLLGVKTGNAPRY
jgi:hypothetical protein